MTDQIPDASLEALEARLAYKRPSVWPKVLTALIVMAIWAGAGYAAVKIVNAPCEACQSVIREHANIRINETRRRENRWEKELNRELRELERGH